MDQTEEWDRYANSPFAEVTCQLNFPDILTITSTSPAAFQEAIRAEYPLFQPTQDRLGYIFSRQDRQGHIALTQNTLSITSASFAGWVQLRKTCAEVEAAFRGVYGPAPYRRTGLRYRSLFRPYAYGITQLEWGTLINAKVLGPFAVPNVDGMLHGSRHEIAMTCPGGGGADRFRLIHGFVTVTDPSRRERSGEPGYLLEQEYFTTAPLSPEHVPEQLDRFNGEALRFFRLCILEPLHRSMAPAAA